MVDEAKLQEDLRGAMKAREQGKVLVLRGLITAIKNAKVEKMVQELPSADITGIVRKELNKRSETIEYARKANRPDMIEANESEKRMLEVYLPQQMSEEVLTAAIRDIAAELGGAQIGPIMAKLRERHAGQFDGKLASEIVKKLGA